MGGGPRGPERGRLRRGRAPREREGNPETGAPPEGGAFHVGP